MSYQDLVQCSVDDFILLRVIIGRDYLVYQFLFLDWIHRRLVVLHVRIVHPDRHFVDVLEHVIVEVTQEELSSGVVLRDLELAIGQRETVPENLLPNGVIHVFELAEVVFNGFHLVFTI